MSRDCIEGQSINVVKGTSSATAKLTSKRGHGGTIEQLIGGHFLYRDIQKNSRIKYKKHSRKLVQQSHNPNDNLSSHLNQTDTEISLVTASAENGNINQRAKNTSYKEESKKTLADQVNEGKYGLIHTELFKNPLKRPGVLSYKSNSEVPKDDANNYGGLEDDEIWLSEDHLLVLNGGAVNKISSKEKWKPIDDYVAPKRQVKLPANPKVPPPFPVQLADDAPLQFIGNNKLPIYNPFTNQTVFLFSNERVPDIETGNFVKKNISAWKGEENTSSKFNGYQYPPPAPLPLGEPNQTFSNPFLNLPPLPPLGVPLPTGSLDEKNSTDDDDEDTSLYYPPPYSFEYKSNYSSLVSPGPLVPGIILPPPPNFFAPLEETIMQTKSLSGSQKTDYSIKTKDHTGNNTLSYNNVNKLNTTRTNINKYNIEIEKVKVKTFSSVNNTTLKNNVQPTQSISLMKTRNKTAVPAITKTQKKENFVEHPPLISLNQQNVKGNPIYFEYFDARTSSLGPGNEYSFTTSKPLISTTSNKFYGTTTTNPPNDSQALSKRPPMKTYLPSKQKGVIPDVESLRLKTTYEFNKEIENIRYTLRHFHKSSVSTIDNPRTPKARPIHTYGPSQIKTLPIPQIHTTFSSVKPVNSQYIINDNPYSQNSNYQTINVGLTPHFKHMRYQNRPSSNGHYLSYDKPDLYSHNNFNSYKNPSLNVEITSANPHLDFTFSTTKPNTQYFDQPNWFTVEKVKVVEIPKPLIYNNGASGYNHNIFLQNKYSIPSYSLPGQADQYKINSSHRPIETKKNDKFSQQKEQDLSKDILINYKHPLPVINFDSEVLPYNGRITKSMIDYNLSGHEASVYLITPHEFK